MASYPITTANAGFQIFAPLASDEIKTLLLVNDGAVNLVVSNNQNSTVDSLNLAPYDNVTVDPKKIWYCKLASDGTSGSISVQPNATSLSSPTQAALQALAIGARFVDKPHSTRLNLAGNVPETMDISEAVSLTIVWVWNAVVAHGTTGAYLRLEVEWLDENSELLNADFFELVNTASNITNGQSAIASIRTPALGATARFTLVNSEADLVLATDAATVRVTQSSRSVERTMYLPFFDDGTLLTYRASLIANSSTVAGYTDPYDGYVDIWANSTTAANLRLYFGSASTGLGGAYTYPAISVGTRLVQVFSRVAVNRTQLELIVDMGAAAGTVNLLVLKSRET